MGDQTSGEIDAQALAKPRGRAVAMGWLIGEALREATGASVRAWAALPQSRRGVC
jgi:hypothetical protein